MPETATTESVYEQADTPPAPMPQHTGNLKPKPARTRKPSKPAEERPDAAAYRHDEEYDGTNLPPVGTEVAYRIRLYGEWVKAVVISEIPPANKREDPLVLDEPDEERVHLAISLNMKRHSASKSVGYRQNVAYGSKVGQWLPRIPSNNGELVAAAKEREATIKAGRLQTMRGDMLHSTDEAIS